jgi:hypothetical protein
MANFTRTLPTVTWTAGGMTLLPAHVSSLDAKQFKMLNGDRGGMWAPSATIDIGGAGLALSGPLLLGRGGKLRTNPASGARIKLNAGEWPTLEPGHTGRTRVVAQTNSPASWDGRFCPFRIVSSGVLQTFGLALRFTSETEGGTVQPAFTVPLRVHNGATLNRVTMHFRVPSRRTAVPVQPPRMRIIRLDKRDGLTYPMKTTADGTGYVSPTNVQDAGSWYAGGLEQTLEWTPDAGTVIDTLNFAYFVQVIEEVTDSGTSVKTDGKLIREIKPSVVAASTAAETLSGVHAVDNVVTAAGDVVLLKNQADKRYNGAWEVAVGAWKRASWLNNANQVTPRFIVRVLPQGFAGVVNGGSFWECRVGGSGQVASFDATTGQANTELEFVAAEPTGNVWLGCAAEFGVTDMRWQ